MHKFCTEIGDIFLRFKKQYASKGYPNRFFLSINTKMMNDSIVFENLRVFVFVRPNENDQPAFSKISTLGSMFKNLRFWWPKTPFTRMRKAKIFIKKYVWTRENDLFSLGVDEA